MQTNTSSAPLVRSSFLPTGLASLPAVPWWSELDPATYAELELPSLAASSGESIDVIVIGGGVAGLSAANGACSTGASVLLLEKEAHLGLGATGRNAGILSAGINMSISDLSPESKEAAFWPRTTALLRELTTESALPGSLLHAHVTGALSLAKSKTAATRLKREVRARQVLGLLAETWTPPQVKELTQGRLSTEHVLEAMWLPDEGCIQPLTLLAQFARKAREAGVQMAGSAYVVSF